MTIWVCSDWHFNHPKILEYCDNTRPYNSVQEMNEDMIERWNSKIAQGDEVWFIGDLALSEKNSDMTNLYIFNKLNGNKHLIVGNHDEHNKSVMRLPWASQHHLFKLNRNIEEDGVIHKVRAVLCHFPIEVWENANNGRIHIHGHSHGNGRIIPRRFDVGFDSAVTNGYPVRLLDIWKIAMEQEYIATDHHEL